MFNPLMILLVRSLTDLLDEHPSVVELGNQTLSPSHAALDAVIERSAGVQGIDCEALARLKELVGSSRQESAAAYYRSLGFSRYDAIDINSRHDSLVMDLNLDLQEGYGFADTYDLVTNNGTGEHIFDQAQVLRNVHRLAKRGGIMVHVLPMVNFVNHGFYCFQPCLYYALCRANDYHLLGLGLAHRGGTGIMADLDARSGCLPRFLLKEGRIGLRELLEDARFKARSGKKRPKSVFKRFRRRLGRRFGSGQGRAQLAPGNSLGDAVEELGMSFRNLLVVAVLRKVVDGPFRTPIQTVYADDFSDADMRRSYSAASPPMEGAR